MAEEELVAEVRGGVGRILLNRPKKLNCLSLGMIKRMRDVLSEWERPASGVLAVVVRGAGRAFCSGGDVVSLYHGDTELQAEYVREEYGLDLQVSRLKVPYIAVMDGITMGGGCGISVNGRYRVSTKRTVMAMPECSLGLVPDVGAGHFLGRMEGQLGMFIGLTGYRLEGRDCLSAGLATHYFSSKEGWERLDRLEQELETAGEGGVNKVLDTLFETKKGRLSIHKQREVIDKVFGVGQLEEVVQALELEALAWSAGEENQLLRDALVRMKAASPTSLALTFLHLKSRDQGLEASLAAEQRMQQRCLSAADFREGVRSSLLEKEKKLEPRWSPPTLKQVTPEQLTPYRRPVPAELALQQDGASAWATVLGMREDQYRLAKEGKVYGQVY